MARRKGVLQGCRSNHRRQAFGLCMLLVCGLGARTTIQCCLLYCAVLLLHKTPDCSRYLSPCTPAVVPEVLSRNGWYGSRLMTAVQWLRLQAGLNTIDLDDGAQITALAAKVQQTVKRRALAALRSPLACSVRPGCHSWQSMQLRDCSAALALTLPLSVQVPADRSTGRPYGACAGRPQRVHHSVRDSSNAEAWTGGACMCHARWSAQPCKRKLHPGTRALTRFLSLRLAWMSTSWRVSCTTDVGAYGTRATRRPPA